MATPSSLSSTPSAKNSPTLSSPRTGTPPQHISFATTHSEQTTVRNYRSPLRSPIPLARSRPPTLRRRSLPPCSQHPTRRAHTAQRLPPPHRQLLRLPRKRPHHTHRPRGLSPRAQPTPASSSAASPTTSVSATPQSTAAHWASKPSSSKTPPAPSTYPAPSMPPTQTSPQRISHASTPLIC